MARLVRSLTRAALLAVTLSGTTACLRLEGPPPVLENGEQCQFDSQCDPASVCEYDSIVSSTVCRVRGGCTSHTQCAATQACQFGRCDVAECSEDSTCGTFACDQSVRRCNDSCAYDDDCAATFVCRDGECLSAVCTASTAASVCDGAACEDGSCWSEYQCSYFGCAAGYTCDGSTCVRYCTSDSECERYECNRSLGECREYCSIAEDCQAGFVCKDSFCQFPTQ